MENVKELPQLRSSAKSPTLPKLKTAPIKLASMSTSDDTPKSMRLLLAMIRVLLGDYYDLVKKLPTCEIKAEGGAIMFRIYWPGYWLDIDTTGDATIAEVE